MPKDVAHFNPRSALQDRYILRVGLPMTILSIILMISKETIVEKTGVRLDNATITIGSAFLAILIFHKNPRDIFRNLIDWEIIFFFMGLFIVVGALEFTHVIEMLAHWLVQVTNGNPTGLLFLISTGSGVLSTFIDNVPYNIAMVGAFKQWRKVVFGYIPCGGH